MSGKVERGGRKTSQGCYCCGQLGLIPMGTVQKLCVTCLGVAPPERWGLRYLYIFHWTVLEGCLWRYQLTHVQPAPHAASCPAAKVELSESSRCWYEAASDENQKRHTTGLGLGPGGSNSVWYGCIFPWTVFCVCNFLITWLWNTRCIPMSYISPCC